MTESPVPLAARGSYRLSVGYPKPQQITKKTNHRRMPFRSTILVPGKKLSAKKFATNFTNYSKRLREIRVIRGVAFWVDAIGSAVIGESQTIMPGSAPGPEWRSSWRACWRTECLSGRRTFRNPRTKARACSPPCRPGRGSACRSRHVPIHHRRDRRVDRELRAQPGGQRLHARMVVHILAH